MTLSQKKWRLSPIYFGYFALFGLFIPYIARYLCSQGLTTAQISTVCALFNGMNLIAPLLFCFWAKQRQTRVLVLRLGFTVMALCCLMCLVISGYWQYLLIFTILGFFLSAVLPQIEVIALGMLGSQQCEYGHIRLWGSIGFVCIVWLVGTLLDYGSTNIIIYLGCCVCVLLLLFTYLIPKETACVSKLTQCPLQALSAISLSQLSLLLLIVLFWQVGMASYNTFFDLYLTGQGYSGSQIGFFISFGALCEIAVFLAMSWLLSHFTAYSLLVIAFSLTIMRWWLLYEHVDSFSIVFFSQMIHAFSYGVVHAVSVSLIMVIFPLAQASVGQGLYVSLGAGFGLLSGNLFAGQLWNGSGQVFLLAAFWTMIALGLTIYAFKVQLLFKANLEK